MAGSGGRIGFGRFEIAGDSLALQCESRLSWAVFGITPNILALSSRSPSGRPAAHPTATGWDEELLGHSESSSRTDQFISWERSDWRT